MTAAQIAEIARMVRSGEVEAEMDARYVVSRQVRSGRGPKGNVRAFSAMKTEKFWREASKVMREANDPEAIRIVGGEIERRVAEQVAS